MQLGRVHIHGRGACTRRVGAVRFGLAVFWVFQKRPLFFLVSINLHSFSDALLLEYVQHLLEFTWTCSHEGQVIHIKDSTYQDMCSRADRVRVGWVRASVDNSVGEFGCHHSDKVKHKYSKYGETKAATFWEASEDIDILVLRDARVKDT